VKELKKYPFSKKAVSAMLAATVALSPFVPTSTPFQPTTVEAATTVTDAYNRLNLIYSKLTAPQIAAYRTAGEALTKFTPEDWNSILTTEQSTKMKAALVGRDVTAEEVVAKFASLVFDTTKADVVSKLTTYKASNEYAEFVRIMGEGKTTTANDTTIDTILQLVVDAEKEVWNLGEVEVLSAIASGTIETKTIEIRKKLIDNNAGYAKLNSDLGNKLGTSLEGLFEMNDRILTKLASKELITPTQLNELKVAFAVAAFKAGNPNTGDGTTTIPTIPTIPTTPTLPVDNSHLPVGSYEVKNETSASGVVEVTTVVLDAKVAGLVNLITADKNTLVLNLEKAANGQVSKAQLPASLFTEALKKNPNAVIVIKTADGSYSVPAAQINVTQTAEKLGVAVKDVKFNVYVNTVTAPANNKLKLASKVIDYTLEAVAGTKKETISTFSTYVDRTVNGATAFNTNNSVAVKFNADGTVSSIPTLFKDKEATIKSLTNSTYAIVENNLTFPDVDNKKSWAENYIETLANKLIIQGKTDGKFAPGEEMTRAQFTVLLVKALGLPGGKYEQKFKDVKEADWFNLNGELAAAIKTGIIQGKPDGRFAPNEKITRTQAAIMLNRAMKLDFLKYDMAKLDKTKKVTDFKDTVKLDAEAKASIEAIYQAGIISGKPDGTFDPKGNTRRDQMAKMLAEFLISAKLMNEIK
jgi:hypothetical protein